MRGLDTFAKHFQQYSDAYIVIGGAACHDHFENLGLEFRVTDDIDTILVVEVLNDAFIAHFWEFIIQGNYERNEIADEKQYYRFIKPQTKNFPVQVELFSRTPDAIPPKEGMRYTPIPADEDVSSLSAILMDDDYYKFTLEHSVKNGLLHRADDFALICLKAKAFLDLSERKADGQRIDSKQIKKHKNDVFRLAATLTGDKHIKLPDSIQKDVLSFIEKMKESPPETKNMFKEMGIGAMGADNLIGQLRQVFKID